MYDCDRCRYTQRLHNNLHNNLHKRLVIYAEFAVNLDLYNYFSHIIMQQASINVLRDQAIPSQKLLINNESIDAVEQKILEVISPIDGRVVTTVPREEVFRPVLAVSKFTDADQLFR